MVRDLRDPMIPLDINLEIISTGNIKDTVPLAQQIEAYFSEIAAQKELPSVIQIPRILKGIHNLSTAP